MSVTLPIVYVDYCIIVDLAKTKPERGVRFREALALADGTLFISWAHIIELFSLGYGATFQLLVRYLASFGARFAIIDADPSAVIKREAIWRPGLQNPSLDEDFIRLLGRFWDGRTELSLGILFDAMATEPDLFKEMKILHNKQKENLKELFDKERNKYRTDKQAKTMLDAAQYVNFPPAFITQRVLLELSRETVRTNDRFNPSDGLDLYHAVVSMSYCTHVVLDRKWARRCKALAVPRRAAVFDGRQTDELLSAISSFRKDPV